MSMLKTQEGEIIINQKRGRRGGPAAWPWFRLCLVVWTKQGSQGERTRKLEEEHLWRDVHEVVTFFLSWLPNCVGEKAGVASFTPHFGYSFVYTCTSTVQCRDFPGSILEARLSFYCRELSPFSYTCLLPLYILLLALQEEDSALFPAGQICWPAAPVVPGQREGWSGRRILMVQRTTSGWERKKKTMSGG